MARRANAAMNRGDFQGVGEVFAQDAVLEDLQNAPDQPMKVDGVEAIRTTLSLWAAAFDELHADIEEYIETPNGVVCAAHWRGLASRPCWPGISASGWRWSIDRCGSPSMP